MPLGCLARHNRNLLGAPILGLAIALVVERPEWLKAIETTSCRGAGSRAFSALPEPFNDAAA